MSFTGGNSVEYEDAANGTKLRTVHKTGATTLTTDHCGNAVYKNGVLKMLLNEAGYVSFPDKKVHFYLRDHQGNTRVVADKDGNVEETNAYYPFGGTFTSTGSVQPYKYNGKELDQKNGLNWYDYGARHYDAAIGRWHVVDPMAEKYYSISPYVYCANNPIKFIDPTGMEIEKRSLKEWEKLKRQVESQRNKLQSSVDKLTAKAEAKGWNAEKLASKIGDKTERIASLNSSIGTMGTLEGSAQVYRLSHAVYGKDGGLKLNAGTNVIDIKFSGTDNFVHEMTHAGQFETGDIAFERQKGLSLAQDVFDEVAAYKAQFAYNPSSVSGLASTSVANSFGTITPSWVHGLSGGTFYVPGSTVNTGIAPLNINSTRADFINAYPNSPGVRALPANFILRTSYPNIYYKR